MSTKAIAAVVLAIVLVVAGTLLGVNPKIRCTVTGGRWKDEGSIIPATGDNIFDVGGDGELHSAEPDHCDY